jgi:hypothetical protein
MTNFESFSYHYHYDTRTKSFIKQTISTINEIDVTKNSKIIEEKTLELPRTDQELLKLILKDSPLNPVYVKPKRTNFIEELVYNNLQVSVNKSADSEILIFAFGNKITSISSQNDLDQYMKSYYNPKKNKEIRTTVTTKFPLLLIAIIAFLIYIGSGLISFMFLNQESVALKIGYLLVLLIFEILILHESIFNDKFASGYFLIINGTLLAIGIALVLLFNDTSKLLTSLGYLLIYPAVITLILTIIYGFAQDFINKVFAIIKDEFRKIKLIRGRHNVVKLYFPRSFKRIFLRILSIIFKAIFIATLVIFIIDLEEKALPKNIFTLLILAIPTAIILAYMARLKMYGICQVCGTTLVFSSLEEKVIPAYETSETKYKDHAIKDDTGKILGYVTEETEIITEHPEQTNYIYHHSCSNEKCSLYGYELNKHLNAFIWVLFGLW